MDSTYGDIDILNYLSKKILKKIKAVDLSKLLPEARLKRIDKYLRRKNYNQSKRNLQTGKRDP